MMRQVLKSAMTRSITARILSTCLLNSFSQSQQFAELRFLDRCDHTLPTYHLSPVELAEVSAKSAPDSFRRRVSWRLPSTGVGSPCRGPSGAGLRCPSGRG